MECCILRISLLKWIDITNNYNKFGSEISRDDIKFISILDSIKISSKEQTKEEIITNNEDVEEKK